MVVKFKNNYNKKMEYRIIYNNEKVITYTEQIEDTYTSTLDTVFIGTIKEGISLFRKKNIDYSLILSDFDIVEKELFNVDISDVVIDGVEYNRHLSVIDMALDISSEHTYFTFKIIHDSIDEVLEEPSHFHKTTTFEISNDTVVNIDGVILGEFDYFYDLIMVKGLSLPYIIKNKILEMDNKLRFNI